MPWYNIRASQYGSILVNGYAYPFIQQGVLEEWLPDLTYVSSFSYGINRAGELIPPNPNDEQLLQTAMNNGVATLLVLTAMDAEGKFSSELAHQVLTDPVARDNLVNNIYTMVDAKNFYGVDFDLEFIYADDRDDYVQLVSQTAARLNPAGYIVLVALAPKTYTEQPGLLYEGHDYQGLGSAANLVLLMTYEWGYTYGPQKVII
ncbi:glycosyl hydrolase family 18 protein [Sinanaerobacter chloroacetimidivorans]|jgi:spore germination protein|uniref:GH18 domain-containing protein n=1 Tax=Sinanaerobacter chloroacetimidivorans TaxID=2818044 RepID=A0A8J7W0A8_9FIRM|nr:glycosyl hydrolase family 18 protein [Sinanaerobacter chloroacetimidivorans]MBR0596895.1 hypothetical protein [Sinanaerobacter chloroacetimidivorans]